MSSEEIFSVELNTGEGNIDTNGRYWTLAARATGVSLSVIGDPGTRYTEQRDGQEVTGVVYPSMRRVRLEGSRDAVARFWVETRRLNPQPRINNSRSIR